MLKCSAKSADNKPLFSNLRWVIFASSSWLALSMWILQSLWLKTYLFDLNQNCPGWEKSIFQRLYLKKNQQKNLPTDEALEKVFPYSENNEF